MDILFGILFWIHLMALMAGGTSSVAMPAIGAQMSGATPETRQRLMAVSKRLMMLARAAVVALIVTGPLLLWLGYGFRAPDEAWFGIKMLLVVVLIVLMILGGIAAKKAMNGDAEAGKRAGLISRISAATLALIVLAAVFAFN